MESVGFDVTHLYGLTETFGPVVVDPVAEMATPCRAEDVAAAKARQGVPNVDRRARSGSSTRTVPTCRRTVTTVGEIVIRGNDVMLGYYRDPDATAAVDADGWFRTGDLAVVHPDRCVEITDRAKDVIITGGENVASVEVERAIAAHPDVAEAAVVGWPDETWGEVRTAFVVPVDGAELTEAAVVAWVRERLAGFKVPRKVFFGELPKTSTGKIQKTDLRARGDGSGRNV